MAKKRTKRRRTRKRSNTRYWLIALLLLFLGVGAYCGLSSRPFRRSPRVEHVDGIDVSHYQRKINWQKVAEHPQLQFVYVKATEGATLRDACFAENVRQARKAGLHVGAYLLYTAQSDPDEQFRYFRDYVAGSPCDLIPCIDVEENVSRKNLKQRVMRIVELMEAHYGCSPLLYVNAHVYDENFYPEAARCELWIPNYSRKPKVSGGKRPFLWQCTDRGSMPGIKGDVDLDSFLNGMTLDRLLLNRTSRDNKRQ